MGPDSTISRYRASKILADDGRRWRLEPRKPPAERRASGVFLDRFTRAFLRQIAFGARAPRGGSQKRIYHNNRRCMVRARFRFRNNRPGIKGWGTHGRYITRKTAITAAGAFDQFDEHLTGVPQTLASWQDEGDKIMWRFIISPEDVKADLVSLTRAVMGHVEADIGMPIEWVAAAHGNTEHPHVHVALRGKLPDGRDLRFKPDYIKHGIRQHAVNELNRSLGLRKAEWYLDQKKERKHVPRLSLA